jgi:hypothetical protein
MLLCRNEEVFKMKQRSHNKNKNNSAKHIAILLGICMLSGALTGCGFVANPMQYMKDADEELVAAEQNTDDGTSGNSSAGTSGDNSSEAMQVTDNKIIVIGTYGSISDMINTDDYKSQANIECIQETRDFLYSVKICKIIRASLLLGSLLKCRQHLCHNLNRIC